MNTNISYNEYNGIISYLTDGTISFWKQGSDSEIWPLEGEDVIFAPGGNSFCTLYNGRLLIVQKEKMKSKIIELKRTALRILTIYTTLKNNPADWENTYSGDYIRRKIAIYEKLTDLK